MKNTNALKLSLAYLLAGVVWIYFSDAIVNIFFPSEKQQQFYQTIKGLLYVVSTALLLYILLRRFYEVQLKKTYELRTKEHTIRESENRYLLLFKGSPLAKFIIDAKTGMVLEANDKAAVILGYSQEQIIGWNISDILAGKQFIEEAKGVDITAIVSHQRKDGSIVKIEVSDFSFRFKGKDCILLSCNDVTTREESLGRLNDMQQKLLAAQKIAHIGYWQYMIADGSMFWSDEVYEIFGIEKTVFPLNYQVFFNSIHPDDKHFFPESVPTSFEEFAGYDIEHRIVLPDGSVKWIHGIGSCKTDGEGIPLYLEGTVRDITAQKLISISLEENLQRYDCVVKAISDVVWDLDLLNNSVVWSDAGGKLLPQIPAEQVSGGLWEDHIIPQDRQRVLTGLKRATESSEQYWSDEYRCMGAHGAYIFVRSNGYILRNNKNIAIRVIGAITEITEAKRKALYHELTHEINRAFGSDTNLEDAFTSVLSYIRKTGNFELTEGWIVGKEKKLINLIAYSAHEHIIQSFYSDTDIPFSFKKGEGMPGVCWEVAGMLHWDDIYTDRRFKRSGAARKAGITCMYAIPLMHNAEPIGVIILGLAQDSIDAKIFSMLLDNVHSELAAEIRRKQTEQELNQLFLFVPDIVSIAGVDGFFKKVNPAASKILGYTEQELLSKAVTEFVHPDDVERTAMQIGDLKNGKQTIYFENRYVAKSGAIKWIAWTSSVPSKEGLVFSVGKDVTDEKELELLLTKATSLAKIGAWEINLVDNTIHWSAMTRQIHGINDNAYNPSFDEAIAFYKEGTYRDEIVQKVTEAIQTGMKWDIESQIVTRQNEIKWVRSVGEPEYFNGKCIRIVGSFQDIDHIKRSEIIALEALKEKEIVLERIGEAFFAVDRDWTITYWNNTAERVLGRRREEVMGCNVWEEFPDAVDTPFYIHYHEALATGESRNFQAYYEGVKSWFDVSVFPSDTGLSIFFRDITELKNYIGTIEQNNQTLKEIAWSQSHEVRAPVARILGLVSLINTLKLNTAPDLYEVLEMIETSASDLDDVIRKINDKAQSQ